MTQRQRRLLHPPKLIRKAQTVTTVSRNLGISVVGPPHAHCPAQPQPNTTSSLAGWFAGRPDRRVRHVPPPTHIHTRPLTQSLKHQTTHINPAVATGLPTPKYVTG